MTEEPREDAYDGVDEPTDADAPEASSEEPDPPATTGTGHPAVDEVLRSLDALADSPVDEHVAVFEQAHEQLRQTLSGAGDDQD